MEGGKNSPRKRKHDHICFRGATAQPSDDQNESSSSEETVLIVNDFGNLRTQGERSMKWKEYYMGLALLAAQKSKAKIVGKKQVGAVVINEDNGRIAGIGWNGLPGGSKDYNEWKKRSHVTHAEMNAILHRNAVDLKGLTMYTTFFPCEFCANAIIQAGIRKVVYLQDQPEKYKKTQEDVEVRLKKKDIKIKPFKIEEDSQSTITLNFMINGEERRRNNI